MAAALATAGLSVAAQTAVPGEISRPVIPPGKVGAKPGQGPAPAASPVFDVTIAELASRPRDYVGRNVNVASTVEEIFTPWAIKLDERQLTAGGIDSDLLVLAAEPLVSMGFDRSWLHKKISVTGTIRMLQASDFRREYGRGVDDKLFRRYEGKPVLVATSMRLLQ